MKQPRDYRALIFYIIATLMLWQLGASIGALCTGVYAQMSTQGNAFASFVYMQNTGGAFSIFSGHPYVLCAFGVLALLLIVVYVYKRISFEDKFKIISLTLFSAGILGNLYERLSMGYVVDYIKLNFVNFAVFNAFDIMICAAVAIFLAVIIFEDFICKKLR